MHPHCRSSIAPFFGKNPSFRRARNADGKNEVIPFMTFDEWKKTMSIKVCETLHKVNLDDM
jgi:hypothetical protein